MTLKVISPFSQRVVFELPLDSDSALDTKLDRAQEAFQKWRQIPLTARIAQVQQAIDHFDRERDTIARELSLQMGKPICESRNEIDTLLARLHHLISIAEKSLAAEHIPSEAGFIKRIQHEPLGLVFDIAAWNYPLLIAGNVVLPALLAGNSVVLKHSAKTPLCGLAFEAAFSSLEVPNLVTNLVISHDQTSRLLKDPRVNHAVFTGSVPGGRRLYQDAAQQFIDIGLELGGKDPAYIAPDADLAWTVPNIVEGACYNAGQSCCGIERVYVHETLYEEFIQRAEANLKAYILGDPLAEDTTLGPLADRSGLALVEQQVQSAVAGGARLVLGGGRVLETDANFCQPTLVVDVANHMDLMQEESFAPVVAVMKVRDDDEAIAWMNDSRFGLTASVWTDDDTRAERFAAEVNAGTVFQNRCDYCDPALPWTGWGESGKGSSLSHYGFWHLTRRKAVHFRKRGLA